MQPACKTSEIGNCLLTTRRGYEEHVAHMSSSVVCMVLFRPIVTMICQHPEPASKNPAEESALVRLL